MISTLRVVQRVARLRIFALPVFPRTCLREALALYHLLTHAGFPVHFCVGVRKDGSTLVAHSWVALNGHPIDPADRNGAFSTLYSYSAGNHQVPPGLDHRVPEFRFEREAARI